MIYKKDSFFAHLYRLFYLKEELPTSFCDYFFEITFALITAIFVWPTLAINYFKKVVSKREDGSYRVGYTDFKTWQGLLFHIMFVFAGALFIKILMDNGVTYLAQFNGWTALSILYVAGIIFIPLAFGSAFIVLALMLLGYRGGELLFEYLKNLDIFTVRKQSNKNYESQNLFKMGYQRFKAFKEKNCPRITWI